MLAEASRPRSSGAPCGADAHAGSSTVHFAVASACATPDAVPFLHESRDFAAVAPQHHSSSTRLAHPTYTAHMFANQHMACAMHGRRASANVLEALAKMG